MLDDGDYCIWGQRFGTVSQNIHIVYSYNQQTYYANGALENREFIYCLHNLSKQMLDRHVL